jgi:hypothetical protein
MANWTFDPSQYEEKNFELIPIGDYRARIEEVTEKTFKSGNQGYEITLAINGQNSRVWYYLVLDPSNPQLTNQRIGEFFNSFGITSPAMGTGKQWIGSVGAVRIKHDDYQGDKTAKVAYVIARSRQDKLPAWQNRGGAAPAPTAAPEINIPSNLPFE